MMRPMTITALFWMVPSMGWAHPDVDAGIEHYELGEFEAALHAFASAEAGDDVSRDELTQMFLYRSLVQYALDDTDALETDLLRLASLEQVSPFSPSHPPPVRQAFERVRVHANGGLAVTVVVERNQDGVRLEARVERDMAGLARKVLLSARLPGNAFRTGSGRTVTLQVPHGGRVEYFAIVTGPGGAVIASRGTPRSPVLQALDVAESQDDSRTLSERLDSSLTDSVNEDSSSNRAIPWIAAGAGVAIVTAVVAAVLVRRPNPATDLRSPTVVMP